MKMDYNSRNARFHEANRVLRLEDLEARELLSVNPDILTSVASASELAPQNVEANDTIDLSAALADSTASTGDLEFVASADVNKQYTMSWPEIEGAELYNVRVSRDGGETWTTYAKTTETSVTVKGLEPGRTYSYQVYGLVAATNEDGEPIINANGTQRYDYVSTTDADVTERVVREGSFSPISIASTRVTYQPTEAINLVFKGAETASASIRWYTLVPSGDGNYDEVEIAEACDLLSYTPTTEEANYDIKVVATGTGESTGSSKELTFRVNGDISATYDMSRRTAQVSWTKVEGASRYTLRIWRPETELTRTLDDGTTETYTRPAGYIDYDNKLEDPTCLVNGLYASDSENYIYKFKVIAYDAKGEAVGYRSGAFAPVSVKATRSSYKAGEEIQVSIVTAGQYSSVEWYKTNDDETTSQEDLAEIHESDVDLDNSQNLSFVTARASATQNIKIVVKGAGLSAGATVVALVSVNEAQLKDPELDPYVTVDRNATANWNLVDNATSYRFLKGSYKEDGSILWKKAATITIGENPEYEEGSEAEKYVVTAGNAKIVDGQVAYSIGMFNAGTTGLFKVVAVNEKGRTLEEAEFSYTNFGLELDHDAYNVDGDVLTATTKPNTTASYQWSVSYDQGATWTVVDGATDASYTISAEDAANLDWYKLVATNDETGAQSVVYSRPDTLDSPENVVYTVDADANVFTFDFATVSDANEYQIEYYLADAENPVWINLTGVTWTTNDDGTTTASHKNASNYSDYEFRVRSVNDSGWSEWATPVKSEISLTVSTTEDVVDPYDGVVSLREAIAYYGYLLEQGKLAEDAAITFDPAVFTSAEDSIIYVNPSTGATADYAGVYSGLNVDGPINVSTDIKIDASALEGYDVTIDGTNTGSHMMTFSGDKTTIEVDGLAFQNGTETNKLLGGGAVAITEYVEGTFTDCQFVDNTATYSGGAVFVRAGEVTFDGCSFEGNSAGSFGGAIFLETDLDKSYFNGTELEGNYVTTTVTVVDSNIENNSATKGGAIYLGYNGMTKVINENTPFLDKDGNEVKRLNLHLSGDTRIANNTSTDMGGAIINYGNNITLDGHVVFSGNKSGKEGGAITLSRAATLSGTGATFEYNETSTIGGALWVKNSTVDLDDTTFTGNVAKDRGGAIYMIEQSVNEKPVARPSVTLADSTFDSNTAAAAGGAIYSIGKTTTNILDVSDSTFTGNTVTAASGTGGGAINALLTDVTVDGCQFDNNSAVSTQSGYKNVRGGAIFVQSGGSLAVTDSNFEQNSVQNQGGAIALLASASTVHQLTIDSTTFDSNNGVGDGLWIGSNGASNNFDAKVSNSSFTDTLGKTRDASISINATSTESSFVLEDSSLVGCNYGVISNTVKPVLGNVLLTGMRNHATRFDAGATLVNCTVVNNSAAGVYGRSNTSNILVQNSIVWGNATNFKLDKSTGVIVGDHTLSQAGTTSGSGSFTGLWLAKAGAESPLADDFTIDPTRSLVEIEADEPTFINVIDGGDNSYVTTDLDLAGNTRVVKYDSALDEAIVDLGAYEVQTVDDAPAAPADGSNGSDGPVMPASDEYAEQGGWALLDEVFADFFTEDAFID